MTLLRTLNRLLTQVETVLLVVFLGVMVVLAFAQVFLRNVFDTSFYGGDVVVRHMVLWAGFMGAAIAVSEERHISIDALTMFLPARVRNAARALTGLFAAGVCYVLFDASLVFLSDERASQSEMMAGVPSWVGLVIIPAGYGLLVLHFVIHSTEKLAAVFRRGTEGGT